MNTNTKVAWVVLAITIFITVFYSLDEILDWSPEADITRYK
ncbi:hypothetical protein MF628_07145 [Paenibacillus polymyxa]|nr:hypothetical protein [Paenibacillus polymyxa]UZP80579.1 hypothetical protein MF628_07145 [Paenibacillus polymyxa]